jgi:hypothetical protein
MATRLYGLFFRTLDGKFVRVTSIARPKAQAVRCFQSALLGNLQYHACLRVIKEDKPQVPCLFLSTYSQSYLDRETVIADWRSGCTFTIKYTGPFEGNRDNPVTRKDCLDCGTVVFLGSFGCFILEK